MRMRTDNLRYRLCASINTLIIPDIQYLCFSYNTDNENKNENENEIENESLLRCTGKQERSLL